MDCKICFEEYKEDARKPRNLPCGHTLCSVCITGNIKNGKLVCPFCREMHVAAAVTDFPVSFAMIEVLRMAINYKTVVEKSKEISLKPSTAKFSNSGLAPELHAGICAEHGSYKLFWCKNCDLWICKDCTVLKHLYANCTVFSLREALDQIIDEDTSLLTKGSTHNNKLLRYQAQLKSCYEKQDAHMQSLSEVIQHVKSIMGRLKNEQDRVETILSDGENVIERMKLANQNLIKMDTIEDITVARNLSQQRYKEVTHWMETSEDILKVAEIPTISEEVSMRLDLMLKINGSGNMQTSNIDAISSFIDNLQKEHHHQQRYLSEKDEENYMKNIINLLQKANIEDSQIWKSILPIFRYNEIAACFFGQIPGIREDTIKITDSTVSLYAAIFKTNQPQKVTVKIWGNTSDLPNITELFHAIRHSRCKVDWLQLIHLYLNPEHIPQNKNIILITEDIIERCQVRVYRGPVLSNLRNIPESIKALFVTVPDIDTLHQFQKQLNNRITPLTVLYIKVYMAIEERHLKDIQPLPGSYDTLVLDIPDVATLRESHHAASLAKRLLPITGNKSFYDLYFPRCQLKTVKDIEGLLQSLNGIKVTDSIHFPVSSEPSSEAENKRIRDMAKNNTGCSRGIEWQENFNF